MNGDAVLSRAGAKFLRAENIFAIEEALRQVGAFGEVHLVVENGRLRYLCTLKSESLDRATPAKAPSENRT